MKYTKHNKYSNKYVPAQISGSYSDATESIECGSLDKA